MTEVLDRPLRVQIVEDERIVALDLRSGLEQMGYEVVGIASEKTPRRVIVSTMRWVRLQI